MIFVKKNMLIVVEVIDGRNLYLRSMTHETKTLDIIIEMHACKVAFNVISSPTNLIVIGLSWLILHNPQVDWHTKSLHFDVPHKITSNWVSEGKDYHLDKSCSYFLLM
jgi:hypothetical protein